MREQYKRKLLDAEKRQWSTPRVEEISLSEDIIRLLRRKHSGHSALDRLAKFAN